MKTRFYVLEQHPRREQSRFVTEYEDAVDPRNMGDTPRCPRCGAYVGPSAWLGPYRIELDVIGDELGDLAFGCGGPLVSERFRDLYSASGLCGLEGFTPVEIASVKGRWSSVGALLPRYLANVLRGQANIDDVASGIDRLRPVTCELCRSSGPKRARRIVLVPGSWTGADVFYAHGLAGRILASGRFKEFCDANAFRNVVLIPAEEYRFDSYPWELKAP